MTSAAATEVLLDTSVLVDFLNDRDEDLCNALEELILDDRAILCGIVQLELLRGARGKELRVLNGIFNTLRYIETTQYDFVSGGELLSSLQKRGITVPATDGLIAALCINHELQLITLDKHFAHFPKVGKYSY